MQVNKAILEKYNVPVPRYTSYPPANHFNDGLNAEKAEKLIRASNTWEPEHIALYVHIPFCRKICFYCGCNACTLKDSGEVVRYMEALKTEIQQVSGMVDRTRKVTQVHFGGGTPNAIPVEALTSVLELFREQYDFTEDAEIAIETNPAYLDPAYLDGLIDAGFNRFSFGIQDFNEKVLRMVNREPSEMPVAELMNYLRSANPKAAINLDFIYGLPGQTSSSFQKTLTEAVALQPDRLVTFSYAHVPWLKKHQQILEKRGLPGAEEKMDMFISGYDLLVNTGYQAIGLDHFVKPKDDLYSALEKRELHRNFQGYCTRKTTGQVYAFGVSAIGQLEKAYLQNSRDMNSYMESVEQGQLPVEKGLEVSLNERIVRELITRLMCNKHLDFEEVAREYAISVSEIHGITGYTPERFREFAEDGLLQIAHDTLEVTETGSLFIRNIAAALDPAYIRKEQKYSKSV